MVKSGSGSYQTSTGHVGEVSHGRAAELDSPVMR